LGASITMGRTPAPVHAAVGTSTMPEASRGRPGVVVVAEAPRVV
jgi:hypothetical protein